MRFNIVICIFLILAIFGTEIQARWSRILPKSKKNQPSEINSTQKSTSEEYPFLPKQFQDKSTAKIYEGYCQFLLGATEECMKQFLKFKKEKFQDKPTTSPTRSLPSETSENIPILFQKADLCISKQNCPRNPKMGSKQSVDIPTQ